MSPSSELRLLGFLFQLLKIEEDCRVRVYAGEQGQTWCVALEGALVEVVAHTQDSLQQLDEKLAGLHLLTGCLQHHKLLPHLHHTHSNETYASQDQVLAGCATHTACHHHLVQQPSNIRSGVY